MPTKECRDNCDRHDVSPTSIAIFYKMFVGVGDHDNHDIWLVAWGSEPDDIFVTFLMGIF